ncbi:FadR/GntR family transcriptional regulator [Ornithinimicrobium faecis]|uniref:FadR/GntR family transcriptional regulator n=1 Tax=Ornithinimicrobium faecis TaxID=2934158 RepID=UPI0021194210|nr:FCD domain-containing protein [Ornithinimicrobium sp. HY1745]
MPSLLPNEYLVAQKLDQMIERAELAPGGRLPTERELADVAGVGRATVRRVLTSMQEHGLVTRHVGRGTFLTARGDHPTLDPGVDISPVDLMDARWHLEPVFVGVAVSRGTARDFHKLNDLVTQGNEIAAGASDLLNFEGCDMEFHHSIAMATHNAAMVSVSKTLMDARSSPTWASMKKQSLTPERLTAYAQEHAAIAAGLVDRDTKAATAAMLTHLRHVRASLFPGSA